MYLLKISVYKWTCTVQGQMYSVYGRVRWYKILKRNISQYWSEALKIGTDFDSVIPLLGIYLRFDKDLI